MTTHIPTLSRAAVRGREQDRCIRCGTPLVRRAQQWHHRRSRSVVDPHRHCPCNGVLLDATCHRWAHANPLLARLSGLIVSRYVAEPGSIPVVTPWGERYHNCEGTYLLIQSTEDTEQA